MYLIADATQDVLTKTILLVGGGGIYGFAFMPVPR
jgi:hypothetical protein